VSPDGRPLLLVVEDDPSLREVTCRILRRRGFETLDAPGAAEALALLATHGAEVRLVLTDVLMPGMSGGELAASVRRNFPDLPIILMSGFHEDPHVRGLGDEGVPVLAKPFSGDELERAVRARLAPGSSRPDAPASGPDAGS